MDIHGRCHCGNFSFLLAWAGDAQAIPARACSCSFCRKHGAAWTAHPGSVLDVTVRDPSAHVRYRFGTRTADFHVCAHCGGVPVATSEIDGRLYAVANVVLFEDVDPSRLRPAAVDFDGEEADSRLARRREAWIAQVRFG